jgi:flavin-dependent dehydrogenase
MLTYDLAIAGGGPAGLALAARVAERGLSVVVLEAAPAGPDKACGEGLMPAGVRALVALGVAIPAESARFVGIRYVQEGSAVEARFRDGSGLGVRRTVLVRALEERARAAGAEVRHGCSVLHWEQGFLLETTAGPLRARVLAGADGLASPIRVAAGLDRPVRGPGRFGVRRHYEIAPWTDMVEVHWESGVEAYVTPVGPRLVGVAFLFTKKTGGFDELLARFPALEARLRGAPHASETRGAGPLERAARSRFRNGVVLVGDAAGYVDAITGEGLTLAFLAGEVLADELARGRRRSFPAYERAFRRLFFRYEWLTRGLLLFSRHPRVRERALALLARRPRVFEVLFDLAV